LLYVVVILDPRFKVDEIIFGLGLDYGQAWAELIAARVWETFCRLFYEFTVLRDGNIVTPTPTPPSHRFKKSIVGIDVDWTGVRGLSRPP